MRKLLFRSLLAVSALIAGFTASAQMPGMQVMPVDSAVRIGHLDNGLTYYIRQNANPKGQADFYIAQKVGSVLEEENQRGLAHFLEHMCFNGTENFPGNSLIDWLESVGVKFGNNLNAYTSIDETVYNISAVPTARKSVQDSCLLILHDWACALTLDPEEIDKERGVIHEEWRRSSTGQMRLYEKLLPIVYPENRYGERLPIGTMEVVDNFPPQALVDYYHTWYRPDQQGVIVVGDIDPDYIEAKIKELFSPIPMPENAKPREYFEVEDHEGTIYAIGADPEMTAPTMLLMYKFDKLVPFEYNNTNLHYMMNYLTGMAGTMLNNRLRDLALDPATPFASASVDIDEFFLSRTKDALMVQVTAKGDDPIPALQAVYRELLRATRGGFTAEEYERARNEFLSQVERNYNNRNDRKTDTYSREYVRAFIDNEPIPGEAVEFEYYNSFVPMMPVEAVNSLLPDMVTEDNRVFMAMLPDNGTQIIPTEEQVAQALAAVDEEDIEPYQDAMRDDPLIPELPAPGKIVAESHDDLWDATVLTLSNGVKVVVKPTQFKQDEIVFKALALGGKSTLDTDNSASYIGMDYVASANGLFLYSNSDVEKYLQGKQAGVSIEIDNYDRELSGQSTVKDLPTLMELIYANFVGYNLNETEFEALRNMFHTAISSQEKTPEFQFQKVLLDDLFASPNRKMITGEIIENVDRQVVEETVKNYLANAADFTFFFVGNIDMDTFRPLAEQYLATLPTDAAKSINSFTVNPDTEYATGEQTHQHYTQMQNPQSWVFIGIGGNMPYNVENKVMASMASQIFSNRLLKKIREEMGATYSIGCYGGMNRTNNVNVFYQIPFPMKPELKEETMPLIREMLNELATTIQPEELDPIKEYMVKNAKEAMEQNDSWSGAMSATMLNGVPTFFDEADAVMSITIPQLQQFVADLLAQGNYNLIMLDPTAE